MKITALLARQVWIPGQDAALVGMAMDQNDPEEFQSSANNAKWNFVGGRSLVTLNGYKVHYW